MNGGLGSPISTARENSTIEKAESQEEFFSDRDNTAEETAAEKEFGTTKDFNEAGYILADGNLLN